MSSFHQPPALSVAVPDAFRAPPHRYPVHQAGHNIESFFGAFWTANIQRIACPHVYLPVYWTNYYMRYGFWPSRDIQALLDRLDPAYRYFTVVQNDNGVLERLPPNVLTFAAGGVGDVPVPLLCDPHPTQPLARDIFASFVGVLNNPNNDRTGVRSRMVQALASEPGFVFIEARDNQPLFEHVMSRSIFALCPRGYGRTSFRLYEAMQLGAIPVYIYDEPWLPYTDVLDWNGFSVLAPIDRIAELPALLRAHTADDIAHKQHRLQELFDDYFTLPGTSRQIVRIAGGRML